MRSRQGIADANLAPVGRKNLISLSLPAKRRSERFNSHCICVQTALAVTTVLATRILILDDSFSLAKKSFEISQPGARQLFSIILSRLPPLLQMSLKQASSFIRPMNLVVRGSVATA
jgi:hypothetical protein